MEKESQGPVEGLGLTSGIRVVVCLTGGIKACIQPMYR